MDMSHQKVWRYYRDKYQLIVKTLIFIKAPGETCSIRTRTQYTIADMQYPGKMHHASKLTKIDHLS